MIVYNEPFFSTGPTGPTGNKGGPGLRGLKGEIGYQGLKGDKGQKGDSGSSGPTGLTGLKGVTGQKGMKGDKEERNGGTVYVRWGHDECPSTTQLVYSGRAGGPRRDQSGGGSNPQCLPLDPNYLTPIIGSQYRGYMYGAEYETGTYSNSHIHGVDHTDVLCAVCHVRNRTAVYMVPAKYTCPTGWTREYYGYLMTSASIHRRTLFTCIDKEFKPVIGSSKSRDGFSFYFVEGRCGTLPCPPYDNTKELSCAVCTK